MRRLSLFVFMLVLFMGMSASAEQLTLDDCIRMAMDSDPGIIRSHNSISSANATVRQAIGGFLPTVGLSASMTDVNSGPESPRLRLIPGVDSLGNTVFSLQNAANPQSSIQKYYGAGLSMSMTLFNGLSNYWNLKGSKASKKQSQYDYYNQKSELVYLIKGKYYLVLKAKKDLEVARDAVKRSKELLKLFQEKYDLGSASLSEVLKQKVRFGNDKLTKVRTTKNLEVTYDILAIAIGLDPSEDFDIANIELIKESTGNIDALVAKTIESHPAIIASRASVNAFKYDVRSAWGGYLPSLSLSYDYSWSKGHFNELVKLGPFDHSGTLRLVARYNIFDGFTREKNMNRAKIGLNNANYSFTYNRNLVLKNLHDAYLGIKLAEETISVTTETELAASEDMDLVQAKYNLGAAALWELLDAQVSLKEASFNKVKSEFDYNLAIAQLKKAMGEY